MIDQRQREVRRVARQILLSGERGITIGELRRATRSDHRDDVPSALNVLIDLGVVVKINDKYVPKLREKPGYKPQPDITPPRVQVTRAVLRTLIRHGGKASGATIRGTLRSDVRHYVPDVMTILKGEGLVEEVSSGRYALTFRFDSNQVAPPPPTPPAEPPDDKLLPRVMRGIIRQVVKYRDAQVSAEDIRARLRSELREHVPYALETLSKMGLIRSTFDGYELTFWEDLPTRAPAAPQPVLPPTTRRPNSETGMPAWVESEIRHLADFELRSVDEVDFDAGAYEASGRLHGRKVTVRLQISNA
ncbi:hypothetical protein [Gordonia sp. N1V]|uniref:hypothetical protein n=1 Tax=Gordonia sp. N1V TaxID=3034163 RepID=UPI0023E1231A|nr:hypothetical protein [Gordonia sp. N1V]MDF3280905.1 hypothetical protein [Gordonia sp. N1V]